MNTQQWRRRIMPALGAGLAAAAMALSSLAPVGAAPFNGQRNAFADERFANVWQRTDDQTVRGGRSWYWGPQPWFDYAEFYRQGVNGLRTVQYFDKARMEINNPNDRSYQEGVTNGLLVKELVSGRMQLGNDPYDADSRAPADVPVAGNPRDDNPSGPGYAVFQGVATLDNGYRDPQRLGQRVSSTLDRGGNLAARAELALPETEIVQYNSVTGHNIPRVFWDFMSLQGPVLVGGRRVNAPVVDWLFALGLPISDPYWVRAKIGAVEKDVMVQLFERRVLTYVPDNPEGYKVEMGNVGQHYFQWRYPQLGQPWATPNPNPPLLYASSADTGKYWELYLYATTGRVRLTQNNAETVAFSYRRSFDPKRTRVYIDSRRDGGQYRQIYELDPAVLYGGSYKPNADVRRVSFTNGDGVPVPVEGGNTGYVSEPTNEYNANVSPDGNALLFISERTGKPEVYIVPTTGSGVSQLTSNNCINEVPTWSPDGRSIFWEQNCDGDFEIYRADLSYSYASSYGIAANLVNTKQLTNNSSDDRFARVSPDGRTVAFSSNREGNFELYLINSNDGSGERRLTSSNGDDDAPTWSADGQTIAFASNRGGSWQIYSLSLPNSLAVTQLTNDPGDSRWPLWAQ